MVCNFFEDFRQGRISFKSIPEFYEKEKSGKKNNTVREVGLLDVRLIQLLVGLPLKIRIINTKTGESFTREIRDISFYFKQIIITWHHGR